MFCKNKDSVLKKRMCTGKNESVLKKTEVYREKQKCTLYRKNRKRIGGPARFINIVLDFEAYFVQFSIIMLPGIGGVVCL